MAEFEKIQSTQFVSRIFEAISQLVSAIINIITWLGKSLTTLIFTFYFLFKIDAEITLAFIPLIPCMAILTKIISSKKKALSKKEAEKSGFVKDFIQEIVSSFKEIKVYNCSKWVLGKYDDLENQWKNARIKSNFLSSAVFWLLSFFGIVVVSVILVLAINKTLSHELNPGDITAMILYSGTVFNGVMEVFNQIIVFKNLEVVIERYNEIMKSTYSDKTYNENLLWSNSTYDIEVSNVNFAFDKNKNILENINFKIPFGSSVAIIGQSGSGKTTLLKLLLGLYVPTKGKVKIGGMDISDMSNEDRCRLITCAFQDTFIYNSSIYDNIVLGKSVTNELFTNSLAMSDLLNFICELPNGSYTQLKERGSNLSGGQKQRVGIARCFISTSKIILLDEISSALDNITERNIIENLKKLKNKTRIVVSHKPDMILWTDYVIVIANGRIIDMGTHAELRNRCKTYLDALNS